MADSRGNGHPDTDHISNESIHEALHELDHKVIKLQEQRVFITHQIEKIDVTTSQLRTELANFRETSIKTNTLLPAILERLTDLEDRIRSTEIKLESILSSTRITKGVMFTIAGSLLALIVKAFILK